MDAIWPILVPVLITVLTTAGVIVGSAMGYFKLKGIAFFDRKTAELKEQQLKEETDRKAKLVAQETANALSVKIEPMTEQLAKIEPITDHLTKVEERLDTFIALSNVQKKLLENQGVDIDELKNGKANTEKLLEKAIEELAKANETISNLAIGYYNLNQNFKDAGIKYDGAADAILEQSKRTIAQTSENVPANVGAQMRGLEK